MPQIHSVTNDYSRIYEIEIKDIKISDLNVRKHTVEKDLKELADSIKQHGQLQPIVLRGTPGKPPYDLIIGQRRLHALKDILGEKKIKSIFIGHITDIESKIRSLVENMMRTDLSYEDTADAITFLYTKFGRNDRKVADHTGLSLNKVRQFIYIAERASPKTKVKLREGKVTAADVKRALKAASDNIEKADELLDLMQKHKLDRFQKSRMVYYGQSNPKAPVEEIIESAIPPAIETAFVVRLSAKVRKALIAASKKLAMNPDELAAQAVEEWLRIKGFSDD